MEAGRDRDDVDDEGDGLGEVPAFACTIDMSVGYGCCCCCSLLLLLLECSMLVLLVCWLPTLLLPWLQPTIPREVEDNCEC